MNKYYYNSNAYFFYRMIGGVLIVLCFWFKAWKSTPSSMLQNSFFTFCLHSLLIGFYKKIFMLIFGNNTMWVILEYTFCAGAVWFSTVVIAEGLKKYFPQVYLVLNGGRKGIRS